MGRVNPAERYKAHFVEAKRKQQAQQTALLLHNEEVAQATPHVPLKAILSFDGYVAQITDKGCFRYLTPILTRGWNGLLYVERIVDGPLGVSVALNGVEVFKASLFEGPNTIEFAAEVPAGTRIVVSFLSGQASGIWWSVMGAV